MFSTDARKRLLAFNMCFLPTVERGWEVLQLMMSYLESVCEDSVVALDGHENSLASALSVVSVLLPACTHSCKLIHQGNQCLSHTKRVSWRCYAIGRN